MQVEDKLVIAKLLDKIRICKTRNRIVNTEKIRKRNCSKKSK